MDFTSTWHWPQWTWLILALLTLIVHAGNHGQPRTGEFNGFVGFLNFGLALFILACGGFFS